MGGNTEREKMEPSQPERPVEDLYQISIYTSVPEQI